MPLKIEFTEIKSFQVAQVSGYIRVHNVPDLKTAFASLEARTGNVALDLSQVPAVDKGALNLFVNMQKRMADQGRKFCLLSPSARVGKLLRDVNLDKRLTVYPSRQAFDDEASGVNDSLFPPPDYDFQGKLYKVKNLLCGLCGTENIRGFVLNRGTQEVVFDGEGFAPAYRGKEGFNDLDVLSLMITLCPGCYFATQHVSYFTDPEGEFKTMLVEKEKLVLAKEMGQRRQVAKGGAFLSVDEMRAPFSGTHRLNAYLLAEESAHALHRAGNRLAVYDLGLYNAILTRFCGRGNEMEYLRKAFMWFGEIDKHRTEFSRHMVAEACFYLSVIGLELKKHKEAKKFFLDFKALGEEEGGNWEAYRTTAERLFAEKPPE